MGETVRQQESEAGRQRHSEAARHSLTRQRRPMSVEVRASGSRGQGLFAVEGAAEGQLLFEEIPFCWNWCGSWQPRQLCEHCGAPPVNGQGIRCSGACGSVYCTAQCLEAAADSSHRFLCEQTAVLHHLAEQDADGLLGCAVQLLSMIVQRLPEPTTATQAQVEAATESVLSRWSRAHPFTLCMHAAQCGGEVTVGGDDSMQPELFCWMLEAPSQILRRAIFTEERCGAAFVAQCMSDQALDGLMGMLLTNNQHVQAEGKLRATAL